MKRPIIPDAVRLVLVALGFCCLAVPLLALWAFRGSETAEGIVVLHPVVEYGRTNMHSQIAYTRANGTRTFVMSSDIPASAHAGDHFAVVYDPQHTKGSWVLTDVLSIPAYAAVLGVVLTSLGLFARGRRRIVFTKSQANAA